MRDVTCIDIIALTGKFDRSLPEDKLLRHVASPKLAEEAPGLALGRNRLVFVQQSIEHVSSIFTKMRGQRLDYLHTFSRIMSSIDCWVFFCKRSKIVVKIVFLQAPHLGAG